jgi:hypothetical protein
MRDLVQPPTEDDVDTAVLRLELLAKRARENLKAAGRDPGAARVAITWWRESMGLSPARFRVLLAALERRHLVAIDGAYAWPA